MNINDLTIEQTKELSALLPHSGKKELIGDYVIVRCRDAGVHAGYLVDYEGRNVTLKTPAACGTGCALKISTACLVSRQSASLTNQNTRCSQYISAERCVKSSTTDKCQKSIEGAKIYYAAD